MPASLKFTARPGLEFFGSRVSVRIGLGLHWSQNQSRGPGVPTHSRCPTVHCRSELGSSNPKVCQSAGVLTPVGPESTVE